MPPHLVYVLIDDLGFNDWFSSSDLSQAWPNAAALAAEHCVALDWFYTQPLCTPTRAALLTGRFPTRLGLQHGVIQTGQNCVLLPITDGSLTPATLNMGACGGADGLPLAEETLAEALKRRGYRTHGIGKWHLGQYTNASLPTRRGFDNWYGYMAGAEDHYNHTAVNHAGQVFLDLSDDEEPDRGQQGVYEAELFARVAAQRIQQHRAQHPRTPLFLFYAMQEVHFPLAAPPAGSSAAASARALCAGVTTANGRDKLCKMAVAADEALGNLTRALRSAFADEDVVMVVSGDNGGQVPSGGNQCPSLGDSRCLKGMKGTVWEGGVRNNAPQHCAKQGGRAGTTA